MSILGEISDLVALQAEVGKLIKKASLAGRDVSPHVSAIRDQLQAIRAHIYEDMRGEPSA